MQYKNLFKPIEVGTIKAENRFFMAPLTRCRADPGKWTPNDLMVEYYSQRSGAGLIISEFAPVTENTISFHTEAAIYNDDQAWGWKKVVDKVHENGGKMFCQLAHGGRAAHPLNNGGEIPVAPSALPITHRTGAQFNPTGKTVKNPVPREMADEEVPKIVDDFIQAALRAIDIAGFDGVEIHAANGYLINQFSSPSSNKRPCGPYSGKTMGSRCKFLFDILEGCADAIGNKKVGLRISPVNSYQDMVEEDPVAFTKLVATKAEQLGLAYLHVIRGDYIKLFAGKNWLPIDIITPAREKFSGPLVVNLAYETDEAERGIADGKYDAVAFGSKFLANPDLPERVLAGVELNEADTTTFYSKTSKGYTDYPFLDQSQLRN